MAESRRGWRIAAVLGVIFGIYALAQNLDWLANYAGVLRHGDFGILTAGQSQNHGDGRWRVVAVTPGSPAAAAGITAGETLTFDPPWAAISSPVVGDRVALTLPNGQHVVLTATGSQAPVLPGDQWGAASADLSDIPAVLLGMLILVRGRSRPAPVLLGIGLVTFGLNSANPSPSLSGAATFVPVFGVNTASFYGTFLAFLAFALVLLDDAAGRERWRWQAYAIFAAALGVLRLLSSLSILGFRPPFFELAFRYAPFTTLSVVSLVATFALLITAWWRAPAAEKHRLGLLAAAFGCIVVNQTWFQVMGALNIDLSANGDLAGWPTLMMDIFAGIAAPALFAYAILRHRVLDLGFAINRTLVYGVVSAILLGAFGLIEWAFDHFVKIQGREQNALIDAAIALGVYLGFHRVTGFVEHAVEALFFRRWQEKEAELRRFVADAGFVTRREKLLEGFVGALTRFADGAEAAIYLKAAKGGYARAAGGGGPKAVDEDDPALVRLRAERRPVEPADAGSPLAAALVCPMLHRGEMIGFVAMAARAEDLYRPDEVELLGWASLQVGLDLHALEVERLQASVTRLEHQLEGAKLAAQPA